MRSYCASALGDAHLLLGAEIYDMALRQQQDVVKEVVDLQRLRVSGLTMQV